MAAAALTRPGLALVERRTTARSAKRAERTRVRKGLDRIVASVDFDASRRSQEFLRFIVQETLAGRGDELTQSAIATRVFDRRDDFDPVVDPIVRIQAGRLRRSLERYYLLSGKHDTVRIELPRGTYVPAFSVQAESAPAIADPPPERAASTIPADDWPSVVINAFEPAGPGSDQEASAAHVTEELVLELGRYREVQALLGREVDRWEPSRREGVRFTLGGRLREEDGDLRVTARLVDHATGAQVWGDAYNTASGPRQCGASLEDIARVIAARVGAEEGVIVQLLATERRKRRPDSITPYGAILLSYRFFLGLDPISLSPALQALRQVVEEDPDCGLAWTRLARLCVVNHTLEVTDIPTPVDQTITYAQYGVRIDPTSRSARAVLASALLVKGELTAARRELEEALQLTPNSLVYLEVIGLLLTLVDDGERGLALIRTARERNPHCLPYGSFGLWFDHLRRGEIEAAYQAALEYRDPTFFWRAAMRACCLGHLGRIAEAKAEVDELLLRKPDFAARGRILIGHYVKFPEVMNLIADGLAKAGLTLA